MKTSTQRNYSIAGFVAVFLLSLSACVEPVDIELMNNPELVVLSNFEPRGPFSVLLSHTVPLFAGDTLFLVDNADVSLFEEGNFLEELEFMPSRGIYESPQSTLPTIGTNYTLKIEAIDFAPAEASNSIPPLVNIESIRIKDLRNNPNGNGLLGYKYRTEIALNDPADQSNYYDLDFTTSIRDVILIGNDTLFISPFPEFLTFATALQLDTEQAWVINPDGGFLFSDELFDGQNKSFDFEIGFEIDEGRRVLIQQFAELRSVSQDYFLYYTSLAQQEMINGGNSSNTNAFNEPIPPYSNIKNAHGIFAGFSSSEAGTVVK